MSWVLLGSGLAILVLWLLYQNARNKALQWELRATEERKQKEAYDRAAKAMYEHSARAAEEAATKARNLEAGKHDAPGSTRTY